jgi:hypothetical protein
MTGMSKELRAGIEMFERLMMGDWSRVPAEGTFPEEPPGAWIKIMEALKGDYLELL